MKNEQRKAFTLIRGDCFEEIKLLENNSIHAVITDPPYGSIEFRPDQIEKMRSGKGGIWRLPPSFDSSTRKPLPRFSNLTPKEKIGIQDYFEKFAKILLPKVVPGGHIVISTQVLLSSRVQIGIENGGFEFRGQIIRVYKTMRGGDRPKFAEKVMKDLQVSLRGHHEPWLVFRRPLQDGLLVKDNIAKWNAGALKRIEEDKPFADVIYCGVTPKKEREISGHPTTKSQDLMRKLVRLVVLNDDNLILDPFMGSGSTIAAAKFLGISSIGIEIDAGFFENAENSIESLSKIGI